jgi:spore coat protein SA
MKNIAIISSGYFPIPAVKGGAVETLIQTLVDGNEENKELRLNIFSMYDKNAEKDSSRYKYSSFLFIKSPEFIKLVDKLIYFIANKVFRFKKHMSFRYIVQRLFYIFSVAKILKQNDFDKLIIENTATLFWVLKLFGNKNKYEGRYIYHLHNVVENTFGCHDIIASSKQVYGVSHYINNTFSEKFPQFPKENMIVFKNCIELEMIKHCKIKFNVRQKYGIKSSETIFIFVGRLCPEKGIKELLEAFSMIGYSDAKLLVVGNFYFGSDMVSDFEKELQELAEPLGDRVVFTGFIHNSEIANYYNAADIAVLPSIWEEPAGLTIIEAMASGLPVITTNSGGIPEYTDKSCTILVDREKNLIKDLVNAMEILYKDKELRRRMQKNSTRYAEKYSQQNYFKNFIVFLENGENTKYKQ